MLLENFLNMQNIYYKGGFFLIISHLYFFIHLLFVKEG